MGWPPIHLVRRYETSHRRFAVIERGKHFVSQPIGAHPEMHFTYHDDGLAHWKTLKDREKDHTIKILSVRGPSLDEFQGFAKMAPLIQETDSTTGESWSPSGEDIFLDVDVGKAEEYTIVLPCLIGDDTPLEVILSFLPDPHRVGVYLFTKSSPTVLILTAKDDLNYLNYIPRYIGDLERVHDRGF